MVKVPWMTHPDDFEDNLKESLTRLAETSDRVSPTVFAGRDDEFDLLDAAVRAVRRGQVGRTVVVNGVPGAGKTALLNEYAIRLVCAEADDDGPVIPVPLRFDEIDAPPGALMQAIDRQLAALGAPESWRGKANRLAAKTSWMANALSAIATKKSLREFLPAAQAPDSLDAALADYALTRFGVNSSTFVLLVDEAQNLADTKQVKSTLSAMHNGVHGGAKVLLACFGLGNTQQRLVDLGLSRLSRDHARTIGPLSNEDARRAVRGTIEVALSGHGFDQDSFDECRGGRVGGRVRGRVREEWIDAATNGILSQSANFPHHLTNGCISLAQILLRKGIGGEPPLNELTLECRRCKREYYETRLHSWEGHATALAHAFSDDGDGWTPADDVRQVLMAADDAGDPVKKKKVNAILDSLRDYGYVERRNQHYRLTLPSLAGYFKELRREMDPQNQATLAVRAVLAERRAGRH